MPYYNGTWWEINQAVVVRFPPKLLRCWNENNVSPVVRALATVGHTTGYVERLGGDGPIRIILAAGLGSLLVDPSWCSHMKEVSHG